METIPFSEAHDQLAATMDRVSADHAPVIITRNGSKACVLASLDDWESMDETAYLLSSPVNAQRLRESIQEFESGGPGLVIRDADDLLS